MAPIRRYLRITKYSVLEVRIYLDRPSDAGWLLSSREPAVLRRIIDAVRPQVLPKLREENENAAAGKRRKGAKKKRGIKDVVAGEDFEATIFLTELSTRHSLLTKSKTFEDRAPARLKSTGNKLTGWLSAPSDPIVVEDGAVLREEEDESEAGVGLSDIPPLEIEGTEDARDGEEEAMFVSSSDEETFQSQREIGNKKLRRDREKDRRTAAIVCDDDEADEKKKLALNTSYDGFSIYGRILCLVVKRKGKKSTSVSASSGGSEMMEQWVSTQAAQEAGLDEEDEG